MYYYQYDAILNTNPKIEHVSYMLKSPTKLTAKDIKEVSTVQRDFMKAVLKFRRVVTDKLTMIGEGEIEEHMIQRKMPMESIVLLEQTEVA